MDKKDKKQDSMPPSNATPEEIGEFWDTHSLADYWDETHEVGFQVDLKSEQNLTLSDETKSDLPTITEDASNPVLDVVTDLALDSTIPAPIRRNMFKAFDRLCSALIDVPVGALERRSTEKRSESEARIKIREEITAQIVQQMKVDPEYAWRAEHKFAEKIIGEQINLDKTAAIAADELKNGQPDNSTNQSTSESNKEQSTGSTDEGRDSSEGKTISDVWINIFETEARPQSTEEGQLLFGRILAGEIRNPGSYSIRTLKTLGELDQNIAVLFKRFCSVCVIFGIPYSNHDGIHIFDARVSSLGGKPGSNALRKYGLDYEQLNMLNEYGLIISEYNSWYDCKSSIVNNESQFLLPFKHQEKSWVLLPSSEQDNRPEFKLSGVALSRVGCELFRIVDQDPVPEYTEDLKKYFAEQKLRMVEVSS